MDWPFGALRPLSYDLIVADPPWAFELRSDKGEKKSAQAQYDVMSTEQIAALPVSALAQRDCLLLLWATGAMFPQALQVCAAWGFTYKSQMAWRKTTPAGKVRMGTGYWARTMHEPVIIATLGKPSKFSAFPSIFDGVAREHSRKPDEFFALVEKHTTGLRRVELFSRESRPGWDVFGDEAGKFDGEKA